jgi:sulfate permease, SulP family
MPTSARLFGYPLAWLSSDVVAGITLAAYAVPVSLAYATLAGLPPQIGVYGYLLGGLGYALAGSSRYLAIGPTSAISLMIGATISEMAGGDSAHYAQIATGAALAVGLFCLLAWVFRLSVLVKLISDSVLTGFKAGAGLTIALTQLPALLGVAGGGHNVPERLLALAGQLGATNVATLVIGLVALGLLWCGERWLPGRPVALAVVALSIITVTLFGLMRFHITVTGLIPPGLPVPSVPKWQLRNEEGMTALALGCTLLAYIEGVAAARAFATRHRETIDPRRELLGLGVANIAVAAFGGFPVAGGLSQTAVNEGAGAKSRLSLVFASLTLALSLLFFTTLLSNLPKAVLAAVVLMAVSGLIDVRALTRMWRSSRVDFFNALAALIGVLLLGILNGILLAALISILLLLALSSTPHVAFLGCIPGTTQYSDIERHPENEPLPGVLAFRPEGSLLYLNAEYVLTRVMERLDRTESKDIRGVVCDLSAAPRMDLAGARMLAELNRNLSDRSIALTVVSAHGSLRDLLRAEGLGQIIEGVARGVTLADVLARTARAVPVPDTEQRVRAAGQPGRISP